MQGMRASDGTISNRHELVCEYRILLLFVCAAAGHAAWELFGDKPGNGTLCSLGMVPSAANRLLLELQAAAWPFGSNPSSAGCAAREGWCWDKQLVKCVAGLLVAAACCRCSASLVMLHVTRKVVQRCLPLCHCSWLIWVERVLSASMLLLLGQCAGCCWLGPLPPLSSGILLFRRDALTCLVWLCVSARNFPFSQLLLRAALPVCIIGMLFPCLMWWQVPSGSYHHSRVYFICWQNAGQQYCCWVFVSDQTIACCPCM